MHYRSPPDGRRSYRIPDDAVTKVLANLENHGQWVGADVEANVQFDHPSLRLRQQGRSLAVTFELGRRFGEIRVWSEANPDPVTVFASGPVEAIFTELGFRRTGRTVVLRQIYAVDSLRVEVRHVDGIGWFCEFDAGADEAAVDDAVRTLGLTRPVDRHQVDRRQGDRRRRAVRQTQTRTGTWRIERRHSTDRRFGRADRRQPSNGPKPAP